MMDPGTKLRFAQDDGAFPSDLMQGLAMPFRASVLTLYPDMFPGPLAASLAGEALRKGLWSLDTHQIRDHGIGRHRNVDDNPAGGGAGCRSR